MATLTNGAATILPDAVDGYESVSEHGNIVHRILGSELVDVTLRPASLRHGSMTLLMGADAAVAAAAETALRTGTVWSFIPGDAPASVAMTFVVHGRVANRLDVELGVWLLSFDWQEVAA